MNELINVNQIKSTELVEIINQFRQAEGNKAELQHKDFMKKIRKEIETLKSLKLEGQGNFSQSSYVNSQSKSQPCYQLNRDGMLEMLNSESTYVRYKTIEYINKLENKIKQPEPTCIEDVLIKSLQEMKEVKLQINETKKQTSEVKQEVQTIRDVITLNPQAAWRRESNRILNAIGKAVGNYKEPKDQVYKALKNRANCRPNVLIQNLKKRAKANGMSQSKIDKLNILDVLENEPRLKEIYVTIVKEIAIKNKVN